MFLIMSPSGALGRFKEHDMNEYTRRVAITVKTQKLLNFLKKNSGYQICEISEMAIEEWARKRGWDPNKISKKRSSK
jgi:hypothetical protein